MWLTLPIAALALSACSGSDDSQDEAVKANYIAPGAPSVAISSTEEVIDETDEETLENPYFHGRLIYLRGEMNDYGVQRPYRLRKFDDDTYCTIAPLRADWAPYRFKFADANWTDGTNFGYATPPAVIREGAAPTRLNPQSRFEELRYEPKIDGIYRFCMVYKSGIPYATVSYLEDGKLTTMDDLIKGELERQFTVGGDDE